MQRLRDNAANQNRDSWWHCLGTLAFCEGGDRIAHQLSSAHPKYSLEETQRELDGWRTKAGASLCETFDRKIPGICGRCPHQGKIKSPIILGISQPTITQPSTNGAASPGSVSDFRPPLASLVFQAPVGSAPAQKQKELGPREKLLRIGLSADLWHDKDGNNFATVDIRGRCGTYTLKGSAFRHWLIREYTTRHAITINGEVFPTAPSDQAIKEATNALAATAAHGAEHQVAVRVAGGERSIFIDLGTSDWSVVEVSADGWRVLEASPVRFVRPPGIQPLPVPIHGGNIRELRRFLNLRNDDFVLIVAWLLAALRPVGPYPVLIVNGEHGAGKTMLCRVVRRLVDPNSAELRSDSRNERDLFLAANNGRIVALDNLSYVRNDLSDAICRIATTGAFATRALYTDGEEFFVQISRPVLLNGIPPLASRPDLADRAIVLNLPAMPETNRRSEEDFWLEFNKGGPLFLGAVLDGLSGAMCQVATVELQKPPRMIDFAKWGEAGWRSLGLAPGAFEEIYTQNRAQSNEDALDADPVAISILRVMANKSEWIGTAAQLLSDLGPGDRDWLWPKNATQLGKHLRRLPPLLRQRGLEIEFDKAPNATRSRLISLKKTKESSVQSVQASTLPGK